MVEAVLENTNHFCNYLLKLNYEYNKMNNE